MTVSTEGSAPLASAAAHTTHSTTHAGSDLLLLVVPGVIWGASFLFIAEGLRAVGPHGVAFARIFAGFITLACFPAARRPMATSAWPRIALLAVFWMAIPLTLFPFAEQRVSSAMAGMLNGAVPLFAAAVAAIFARRMPSREMLLSLGVGLAGVVLIALPNLGGGRTSLEGVLLILIAITLYGIAINVARPLQMKFGALPVLARSLGLATILTAPLGLPAVLRGNWSIVPLLSLIALGALGTGIAYVLSATAAGRLGATRASATIFLSSPIAMLLGVIVMHEQVSGVSLIGAAVCIGGAVMIRKAQEHATQAPRGPRAMTQPHEAH